MISNAWTGPLRRLGAAHRQPVRGLVSAAIAILTLVIWAGWLLLWQNCLWGYNCDIIPMPPGH